MTKKAAPKYKDWSEKEKREHRKQVNAWREANKKAIKAAAAEGISLTKWREKHGTKVRPSTAKKVRPTPNPSPQQEITRGL